MVEILFGESTISSELYDKPINTITMKRFVFFLINLISCFSAIADDNRTDEKPIQLIIDEINSQSDRIITYHLAAYYLEDAQKISVKMDGLGDSTIYIIDSCGRVQDYCTYMQGDTCLYLRAPSMPGYYYLVIDSLRLYAEGVFEVK